MFAGERTDGQAVSEPIEFFDDGENIYAEQVDAGHRIDPRAQKIFVVCVVLAFVYFLALITPQGLFGGLAGLIVTPTNNGGDQVFSWYAKAFGENATSLVAVLLGHPEDAARDFPIWMVRYVVIALAGAGLALSGAVYQGAFRNALVSPSTLGVMSGAQFGMMLWVVGVPGFALGAIGANDMASQLQSSLGLALVSFAGCLAVVALVLLTVRGLGSTSAIVMIITGQMIGGVLGAVYGLVRYYYLTTDPYGGIAELLQQMQIASFYREFTFVDIAVIGVSLSVTFAVVMVLRQRMMALSFDESEQRAMGIDTKRMQIAVVGLCTLLTAIVVSFCGTVGFVGFLVPHLARRLVGPNFKYLLPASTALGALFVLGAYYIVVSTLGPEFQTMVGMYISIAGAMVFLVTALNGKGVVRGGFR